MNYYYKKGFTLIELLIVVAIIAVMSGVVMSSVSSARLKAHNAKRVSDLNQIKVALEFYRNNNLAYPTTSFNWRSECTNQGGYSANNVIPGLIPTYMPSFPSDPYMNKTANTSCYLYISDGVDYTLLDHLIQEPGFSYQSQPTLIDPGRDAGEDCTIVDGTGIWAWKIATSGATCW